MKISSYKNRLWSGLEKTKKNILKGMAPSSNTKNQLKET